MAKSQEKSLQENINSTQNWETIAKISENPVLKVLLEQLVPISGLWDTINCMIQKKQQKNLQILCESIFTTPVTDLQLEQFKKIDAIQEFRLLGAVAQKIRSAEKIRTLGRLYRNTYLRDIQPSDLDHDQFEEWVGIVSEMSDREMDILMSLYKHETAHTVTHENRYTVTEEFWEQFETEICEKYQLSEEEFYALLTRLLRTGFCRNDWKEIGAMDRKNQMSYTTTYFHKFLNKITEE